MRKLGAVMLIGVVAGCNNRPGAGTGPGSGTGAVTGAGTVTGTGAGAGVGVEEVETSGALLAVSEPGVVGTLVVNEPLSLMHPSEYCLDDGNLHAGAPARIAQWPVFTATKVEPLRGKIVLARGEHRPSLLAELRKLGPCPPDYGTSPREMPQMRSDWVSAEGGFRTTRAKLEKLPCFRARSLQVISLGGQVGGTNGKIVVELTNPFAVALDALDASAHYEGGPGKPMPRFEKVALALPPGGKQRLELRREVEAGPAGQDAGTPRGIYRLHSLELRGRLGATEIDVSVWVGAKR